MQGDALPNHERESPAARGSRQHATPWWRLRLCSVSICWTETLFDSMADTGRFKSRMLRYRDSLCQPAQSGHTPRQIRCAVTHLSTRGIRWPVHVSMHRKRCMRG